LQFRRIKKKKKRLKNNNYISILCQWKQRKKYPSSSALHPQDLNFWWTAFKDKEKTYLPLLTSLKPPGFIFKVLAFNTFGAAHQHVHDLLSDLQNKAHFRLPNPTAFNVNIGTAEIIKRALVLADPCSTSTFS
jgi:hypothetical protein